MIGRATAVGNHYRHFGKSTSDSIWAEVLILGAEETVILKQRQLERESE